MSTPIEWHNIAGASPESLCNLIENSSAEFVALTMGDVNYSPECQAKIVSELQAENPSGPLAAIVPLTVSNTFEKAWQSFPASIAALLVSPTNFGITIFCGGSSPEFAQVSDPLWQYLITQAHNGQKIAFVTSSEAETSRSWKTSQLVPAAPDPQQDWLREKLLHFDLASHVAQVTSSADAIAFKAGLLQWHDYLDASHECSQSVEHQGRNLSANYWHGIMHRREPDYSNAKYWFRQTGDHPAFSTLAARVANLIDESSLSIDDKWTTKLGLPHSWDPFAFVDLCQHCSQQRDSELAQFARKVQFLEFEVLLSQTFEDATI